jgi:intracellular sulfur oxidation DsrE/DsrF family protein
MRKVHVVFEVQADDQEEAEQLINLLFNFLADDDEAKLEQLTAFILGAAIVKQQ